MRKVLVADKLGQVGVEHLQQQQDIQHDIKTGLTKQQLVSIIGTYDAIIIRSDTQVDADVISAAKKLRVIGRAGIGVDNIDVDAASQRGIIVMNTPQANSIATAEHTLTSMMALCRHTAPAHASLLSGKWERSGFVGVQLYRKTLGLIGFGRIARLVAQRAKSFDMQVIAHDPYVSAEIAQELGVKLVDLEELLPKADFISLHTSMSSETESLINAKTLSMCKRGVYLINPSRGKLIDEEALAAEIKRGHVAGAAVDVYRDEPPSPDHPLIGLSGVLHTPHLGASTIEAQRDVALQIVEQVLDAMGGVDYRNSVNLPFSAGPRFNEIEPYMSLASKIGVLQFHMADAPIRRIELCVEGDDITDLTRPIATGLLKGILNEIVVDEVNYINAPTLANDRGISITQGNVTTHSNYSNLVSCTVSWEGGQRTISGTLFGGGHPRIVQVSKYQVDVEPVGYVLIMMNQDIPGVIGKVGTLLGDYGVNIGEWRLGRVDKGDLALAFIKLDGDLSDEMLMEIQKLPAIEKLKLVKF